MRREDLKKFAIAKFDDASFLLSNERWSNAYYLAGYSVEFALKACIARQVRTDTIPDRDFFNKIFSHEFPKLIGLAGLTSELHDRQKKSTNFSANWAIASEWRPEIRYEAKSAMDAQLLLQAIGDSSDGVLPWIKNFW